MLCYDCIWCRFGIEIKAAEGSPVREANGFLFFTTEYVGEQGAQRFQLDADWVPFGAQVENVFKNLDTILEGHDITKEEIVKTTVMLRRTGYRTLDLQTQGMFPSMYKLYDDYFETVTHKPARAFSEVVRLPREDVAVQIEVTALSKKREL
eukprot:Platyproteum_vivax@DN6666_c1_g1_i3.p1